MEATAAGHALWALLTAEQMRLQYHEAANETSPSTAVASDQSTQPAEIGSAHTGSKQSAKGRKGSDASADKDSTWQHCLEHVQAAVQAWQGCLHAAEGVRGCEEVADEDTLPQLMLELLYMAGLHGKTCLYVCMPLTLLSLFLSLHCCFTSTPP